MLNDKSAVELFTDNSARVEKEIAFADTKVAKSNTKSGTSGILR